MEHISKHIPEALKNLPAPKSESPTSEQSNETSPSPNSLQTSERKMPEEKGNLRSPWQRRRLRLETITPAVQEMADAVENWCKRVRDNEKTVGRLIILIGVFGSGKTECLKGAQRYISDIYMVMYPRTWKKPINSTTISWPKFVVELEENKNFEHYADVTSCDVVFIDDIGAEDDRFRSGSASRLLGQLLGDLADKFVFITSNIPPDKWSEKWDGRVEDRLLRNLSVVFNGFDPETELKSYQQHQLEKA